MRAVLWVKVRANARFPYYRRCLVGMCLRGQTYQHQCYRHNRRWAKRLVKQGK